MEKPSDRQREVEALLDAAALTQDKNERRRFIEAAISRHMRANAIPSEDDPREPQAPWKVD